MDVLEVVWALVGDAESGSMLTGEVLRTTEGLWLASGWYTTLDGQWRKPVLLIRVDSMQPQWMGGQWGRQLLLGSPIPRSVLRGETTSAEGIEYEVLRDPEVLIPVQRTS